MEKLYKCVECGEIIRNGDLANLPCPYCENGFFLEYFPVEEPTQVESDIDAYENREDFEEIELQCMIENDINSIDL